MHIVTINSKDKDGKPSKTTLLQDTFREGNQVKTRTLARLMDCSEDEVKAIQLALKHKDALPLIDFSSIAAARRGGQTQGYPFGTIWVALKTAELCGFTKLLESSEEGKRLLVHIAAQALNHSRPSLFHTSSTTEALGKILGMTFAPTSKQIKGDLLWLADKAPGLEKLLATPSKGKKFFFAHDVTAAYFDEEENALSLQPNNHVFVCALSDSAGNILSLRCFDEDLETALDAWKNGHGKTSSLCLISEEHELSSTKKTLSSLSSVVSEESREECIQALIKSKKDLSVVKGSSGACYVLYKDKTIQGDAEAELVKQQKAIETLVAKKNDYIASHPTAKIDKAKKSVNDEILTCGCESWLSITTRGKKLSLKVDKKAFKELTLLEHCLVLETTLPEKNIDVEGVLEGYHNFYDLYHAFAGCHHALHDLSVEGEERTKILQGHGLIVMLSHLITAKLEEACIEQELTAEEIFTQLSTLSFVEDEKGELIIAAPNAYTRQILKNLKIPMPTKLKI
jgi:hypothetical protein